MNKQFWAGFLLVVLLGGRLWQQGVLQRNLAFLLVYEATTRHGLNYYTRQTWLEQANKLASDPQMNRMSTLEQQDRTQSLQFLQSDELYAHLFPGRQLLVNPDFENGVLGWIEYHSDWQVVAGEEGKTAVFSRSGDGHSTLSQLVELQSGTCYLFSATGKTERTDNTATIWLYWETYENGRPQGHTLLKGHDNKAWEHLFGVFCLPHGTERIVKVNVAPVNLYGNVTATVGSIRLYELTTH